VATDQAILRVLNSTRKRAAPLVLLDIKGAYPSVPRRDLFELVRVRVDSELANMLSILLALTRMITIGDPASNVSVTQRGLTQGDLKAPALFNLFLDPLLEGLDPEQNMEEVVAYADDITITPRNITQLQAQLDVCGIWGWWNRMTWSTTKSIVVAQKDPDERASLCGVTLPVQQVGKLLGVYISPGQSAEVLDKGAIERVRATIKTIGRWKKAIDVCISDTQTMPGVERSCTGTYGQ
jgi:Reverse transcriptase (RNA-dependent DNA polymerase)